ncbi:MAG: LPS assembly lipoprotein LptE [Candidatus Thiodiazotropha sp.]
MCQTNWSISLRTDRKSSRLTAFSILWVALLLLNGCGFYLKGYSHPSQALNGLYIVGGEAYGSMAGVLQSDLLSSGVILMPSRESAQNTIEITQEQFSHRVLSVDANGKALDYEMRLQVAVHLIPADKQKDKVSQKMEIVRQLSFGGSDELGQRNEAEMMKEDMLRDMSAQIIRRLDAYLSTQKQN